MENLRTPFPVIAFLGVLLTGSGALAAMGDGRGPGPGPGSGPGGGTATAYDSLFTSEHFSGSGTCSRCHNALTDAAGRDVSIQVDWSSTAMAHASRDPIWQAKVQSELLRNPELAGVINAKCSRCHTPMAHVEASLTGGPITIFDNFLNPAAALYDMAMDGVSCSLCHRIAPSGTLGTAAGFSGGYQIETQLGGVDRRLYGPYLDVAVEPMQMQTAFTIAFSDHVRQSALCAACHNLYTPYVDENGTVVGTDFPEQMPYTEWEQSVYAASGQSCQDCHMPRTDGVVMASRPMWIDTLRDGFAIHKFMGGNLLLLDILDRNRSALGVTSTNLAETVKDTKEMLAGAATITGESAAMANGNLAFTLQIASRTGHKLPTGIPLRRIVLHVTVADPQGRIVFESGRIGSDGRVAGLDSDRDPLLFEPHYDLITSPEQVQVYETIMADVTGAVTYTLLRASGYSKDNRLLPAGFRKEQAPAPVRVVGEAATDPDFVGGGDGVRFLIPGLAGKRYRVRAELVYQPLARAFIQDLETEGQSATEIARLLEMYAASPAKSFPMAAVEFEVRR